jgi:hypothetical protein
MFLEGKKNKQFFFPSCYLYAEKNHIFFKTDVRHFDDFFLLFDEHLDRKKNIYFYFRIDLKLHQIKQRN